MKTYVHGIYGIRNNRTKKLVTRPGQSKFPILYTNSKTAESKARQLNRKAGLPGKFLAIPVEVVGPHEELYLEGGPYYTPRSHDGKGAAE